MRASRSAIHGTFFTTMCTLPRTRKNPPPTKYLASLRSCAPSSASGYGSDRTGGVFPGRKRNSAATTTPKKDAYVRNCSVERCLRYTPSPLLAEARLEEVDRQRPAEVDERQHDEDDPGAPDRGAGVTDPLAAGAVADERTGGTPGLIF